MRLRLTPEVRILHDVAIERGERVLSILDQIRDDSQSAESSASADSTSDGSDDDAESENAVMSDEFEDEEGDDEDEGFFEELKQDSSAGSVASSAAQTEEESNGTQEAAGEDDDEPGFLVLEDDAVSGGASPSNPFMEGVGDPQYDSDVEREEPRNTFFSSHMFPDADPLEDEIKLQAREEKWSEGQKLKKRKARRRK